METIEDATTKVITGIEKKSKIVTPKERNLTAYHEAGHAILMHVLEEHAPVNQVTLYRVVKVQAGLRCHYLMSRLCIRLKNKWKQILWFPLVVE